MTRVTGPALSLDASGTLGGVMTFSKWKGQNYVRLRVDPYNPKSPYQTGVRDTMTFAQFYFKSSEYVTDEQKTWWNTYAEGTGKSGANRFTAAFMAANYDSATGTYIYSNVPNPA